MLTRLLSISLLLIGCANQPWQVANLDAVRQAADPKSSTLPSYDLTAGQWVEDQPLLVNKDFNFGMAMSMEGVGVAIAAGMRISKNKELAQTLKTMAPLALDQRWQELARDVKGSYRQQKVIVFAILYGQPQAQLRTVVEFHFTDDETLERFIDVSDWAPVQGDGSWSANNGEKIITQIDASLTAIAKLIQQDFIITGKEQEFSIIGGEAVQRGRGFIAAQDQTMLVVKTTSIPNTTMRLPAQIVTARDFEVREELSF